MRALLEHQGLPTLPGRLSPARGPPQSAWYHWPADSVRIVANTVVGASDNAIEIGGNKMESNGCTYSELPQNAYYEENLLVNFTGDAFWLYAPSTQTYVENIAWPQVGSATGVTFVDPLLTRNAMGA
ncbi:hypothetical protein [Corallococcus llansteffanensis]|uniref:hypothetical protein n=1 Tax=Corallococcus llansteffanensis TaxID=2316731 RepID=UPI001FC8F8D6|nr:hypothetical protein [Corallococcus llansteffanensis]